MEIRKGMQIRTVSVAPGKSQRATRVDEVEEGGAKETIRDGKIKGQRGQKES